MRGTLVWVIVLAACGDDGGKTKIDASVIDDIDAPGIDAIAGTPVKLTVLSANSAVAGVRVYFQGPDSSLVASIDTDANGVASAVVPDGGYVTAVDPFDTHDLRTYAGVKAGDELVLRDGYASSGTVTVTVPRDTDGTVTNYVVSTPCDYGVTAQPGSGNPTIQLDLDSRCKPTTDVLVTSRTAGGIPVHWGPALDVTVSGSTADATGATLTNAPVVKMFSFTNLPASATTFQYVQQHTTSHGTVMRWVGNGGATPFMQSIYTTPIATSLDVVETVVPGTIRSWYIVKWGTPYATTFSLDIGANILREATAGTAWDTTSHQVRWTEAATGTVADWAVSAIEIDRNAGALVVDWTIAAPVGSAAIQFPTLPIETTDYNPGATDVVSITYTMIGVTPGGYDAIRPRAHDVIYTTSPGELATGTSGSASFEIIPAAP